jgi:hypothetical protein
MTPSHERETDVRPNDVGPVAQPTNLEESGGGHHFASLRAHAPACSPTVAVQREAEPLALSEPDDASEQEADRVADAVMRMSCAPMTSKPVMCSWQASHPSLY